MLIRLELNTNDSESVLRHCTRYKPSSGDFRENSRLAEALEALVLAIRDAMHTKYLSVEAMETIDPRLHDAAISLFGDRLVNQADTRAGR